VRGSPRSSFAFAHVLDNFLVTHFPGRVSNTVLMIDPMRVGRELSSGLSRTKSHGTHLAFHCCTRSAVHRRRAVLRSSLTPIYRKSLRLGMLLVGLGGAPMVVVPYTFATRQTHDEQSLPLDFTGVLDLVASPDCRRPDGCLVELLPTRTMFGCDPPETLDPPMVHISRKVVRAPCSTAYAKLYRLSTISAARYVECRAILQNQYGR